MNFDGSIVFCVVSRCHGGAFDRPRRVGLVHAVIPPTELRSRIAEAVERGMARTIAAPAGSGKNLNREAS
ncbi:hypothetical protein [Mycobacterium sp. M23085]|uniref:hypothetical protein n=1 Tax=Mycobacterium sp. M23085 TaxID=3378087 RepID=UPI003877B4E9